jgi:hypothetical protein
MQCVMNWGEGRVAGQRGRLAGMACGATEPPVALSDREGVEATPHIGVKLQSALLQI